MLRNNEFYCVKCKGRTLCNASNIKSIVLKNGRPAVTSKCSRCSTKVFKIVSGGGMKKSIRKKSKKKSKKRSVRKH